MWFTFKDEGYVERWRGEPYGHAVHPVKYDDYGNIWLKKDGRWVQGRISKGAVSWEAPQGTGVRTGKVVGHDLRFIRKLSTDDE